MSEPRASGRAEQTREGLVRAALEIFGRDGFHAASTRAISEAAGVNQALIAYHFGGKAGLYRAVFEHITNNLAAAMEPVLSAISEEVALLNGDTPEDRTACLECMDRILAGAIELFGQPEASQWVKLVMREQQDPTEAFDIFFQGVYREMLEMFTTLVGRVTGQSPDTEATRALTLTFMGQILIFVVGRATTSRHVGWSELGDSERRVLHALVREGLFARFGQKDIA